MMTQVHILTPGLSSPNSAAFLFPLLVHRRALADSGIRIRLFDSDDDIKRLCDCDIVIIDSKFYSPRWVTESNAVLELIARLGEAAAGLFYFDITDSSGWDHARALPYVTAYFKNQLIKDRSLYLKPLYGYRPFTDYYHRAYDIRDEDDAYSEPISDAALLDKLEVGWNSALMDYSRFGPLRSFLYRHLSLPAVLKAPGPLADPAARRPNDLSCRIGTSYARDTVAYQRVAMRERLKDRVPTDRLTRRAFLRELAASKIVVSPFGFGEICYRDYEGFLAGAVVLKPDMTHMETWPDLYRDGETIVTHDWDLSDLEDKIETLLADGKRRIEIAAAGQGTYLKHLSGDSAARLFAERFAEILKVGDTRRAQAAQ